MKLNRHKNKTTKHSIRRNETLTQYKRIKAMIDTKDFRRGNYVNWLNDEPFVIEEIKRDSVVLTTVTNDANIEMSESVNPIPLTEEWLRKIGCIKTGEWGLGNNYCVVHDYEFPENPFKDGRCRIIKDGDGWGVFYIIDRDEFVKIIPIGKRCDYVHQFQNLAYWITGKELSITQQSITK